MREAANLRFELFILSLAQLCVRDLLFLPAQHVEAFVHLIGLRRTLFTQGSFFLPRVVYAAIGRELPGELVVSVLEQAALTVFTQ